MPDHDMSQYVTRTELAGHLAPLAEIRTMLRDDIRELHEGQAGLDVGQREITTELRALVVQTTKANGRVGKLESTMQDACGRIGQIESLAFGAKTEATAAHAIAQKIRDEGCAKLEGHEDAITQLVSVGILPEGRLIRADESRLNALLRTRKGKAAAGGGLVALGALLPTLLEWVKWLVSLVRS